MEPLPSHRTSRDPRAFHSLEPPPLRRDSRDRGLSGVEPSAPACRDSKDHGGLEAPLQGRRGSKDRGGGGAGEGGPGDIAVRRDSKDLLRMGLESQQDRAPELLPRQDSRERVRGGLEGRGDGRDRPMDQPPELLPRQDRPRAGLEVSRQDPAPPELLPRQDSRDWGKIGLGSRQESRDRINQDRKSTRLNSSH